MKVLLITEKCNPDGSQRDGGARVVDSLREALGNQLVVMQFGKEERGQANYRFDYPHQHPNRFERRALNGDFIAKKIQAVEEPYTHLIFIHLSMQFGLVNFPPKKGVIIWTFPMFLTPSYRAGGEPVPPSYFELEKRAFSFSHHILTPSYFEKKQLIENYGITEEKIAMIPRGVDTKHLFPIERQISTPLKFCSIGSIKPQKNTLQLLEFFKKLSEKFPNSLLSIIGPIQDASYGKAVNSKITKLNLQDQVVLTGHVYPENLSEKLKGFHFHLSTSLCETFGRSIFETLAIGLPNIVMKKDNASIDFLEHLPYIQYVDTIDEGVLKVGKLLESYPSLSKMALEIRTLYDDALLSKLLAAKICQRKLLGVSDYDGTLFHKEDDEKTKRSIEAFKKYPYKAICSARSPDQLLHELAKYGLEVDWIIGSSGAIVTDGKGSTLWTTPLSKKDLSLVKNHEVSPLIHGNEILQVSAPATHLKEIQGLRREVYEQKAFINHWQASKLHAVHRLIKLIEWNGQVKVFGDGPYDLELITFFDGVFIINQPKTFGQSKELFHG